MQNLKALIAKLNDPCRQAFEAAAGLCLARTNYEVEIEHVLLKLLDNTTSDLTAIANQFGINTSRLAKELTTAIDRFKTGNARTPALSPQIPRLVADAWLVASVDFGAARVRSGHPLQRRPPQARASRC